MLAYAFGFFFSEKISKKKILIVISIAINFV